MAVLGTPLGVCRAAVGAARCGAARSGGAHRGRESPTAHGNPPCSSPRRSPCCCCAAASGEEMTLTFAMGLEECLLPKYRGLQVVKRWFLKGITGEQAHPGNLPLKVSAGGLCELWGRLPWGGCCVHGVPVRSALHYHRPSVPSYPDPLPPLPRCTLSPCPQPDPRWGPEAVCLAQLEALQAGNAAGVLRFASPQNQAATGPPERFAQMLQVAGLGWRGAGWQAGLGASARFRD